MEAKIAVIGGTGLEEIAGARLVEERAVETPFGPPSDRVAVWEVPTERGRSLAAFLPRHGRRHGLLPSEVPSRANIWALKSIGVTQVLAFSAVGSLRRGYRPGDFVLCDQLIDRTRCRQGTFFGDGVVGHVAFADPYCARMRARLAGVLSRSGLRFHPRATLVVMEGPAFSTRAESRLHRSWGAHLIGMTALPEARLAREAELCYATVAMVSDYDSWSRFESAVDQALIDRTMRANAEAARRLLPAFLEALGEPEDCSCRHAAAGAILTPPEAIPPQTRARLELLYGKYWT